MIWYMTFERSTHILRRRWAFADAFSRSGLSVTAIVAPLIALIMRFVMGSSNKSSWGLHALRDRDVRVDHKIRKIICGQRASQISRFFRRRDVFDGIDGTLSSGYLCDSGPGTASTTFGPSQLDVGSE